MLTRCVIFEQVLKEDEKDDACSCGENKQTIWVVSPLYGLAGWQRPEYAVGPSGKPHALYTGRPTHNRYGMEI